ncbi:unnamed protein product [Prunus brigantina]
MPRHVLNVKSTARYKGYQPKPSTRSPSRGLSGDGPWISSEKSTQPRPTSTLGFWWRPITSLSGSRQSPIGLFPVHRWLSFLNITSSTDLVSPRLLRPTTAQSSHQPKLGSILKEWGSS